MVMKHALFAVLTPSWCCQFRMNNTNLVCLSVKLLLVSSPSACSNSFECSRWNHFPWNWRSWGLSRVFLFVFGFFFCLSLAFVEIFGLQWLVSHSELCHSASEQKMDAGLFVCLISCELSQQSLFVLLHEKVTYEKAWIHSSMNQYQWFLPLESH